MNVKKTLDRLHRSRSDRMLGGVCAGFAETTDTPPWVWRAGFLFAVWFVGFGVVLYLVLWLLMPEDAKRP